MQNIIIDEEFKGLLPALDKETFRLLEENVIQNGCRDSLVLWGDTLIDGHNRYEICTKHEIPFNTINRDFDSREEALIWIITTQVSRRNLTPLQLSNFRGLHYKADRKIVTNADGKNQYSEGMEVAGQNGTQPKKQETADRLSAQYHVSPRTVKRDVRISDALEAIGEVSPEAKRMILSGEVKIEKKVLEEFLSKPKEEIEALAEAVENGTYEKEKPDPAPQAVDLPAKLVDSILASFTPLDTAIGGISDSFSMLPKVTKKTDRTKLKAALSSRIDILEELRDRL